MRLTIRYRDFQHVVPFLVQFGLYATPTAYPAEAVINNLPPWATVLYYLNPMAGVIEGFRWSLLGTNPPSEVRVSVVRAGGGAAAQRLFYFKRIERVMADIV